MADVLLSMQDQAAFEKKRRRGRGGDAAFDVPLPAPDAPDNSLLEQTYDDVAPVDTSADAPVDTPDEDTVDTSEAATADSGAASAKGGPGAVDGVSDEAQVAADRQLAEKLEFDGSDADVDAGADAGEWVATGGAKDASKQSAAAGGKPGEVLHSAGATMMSEAARTLLLAGDKEAGLAAYKDRMYRKMGATNDEQVRIADVRRISCTVGFYTVHVARTCVKACAWRMHACMHVSVLFGGVLTCCWTCMHDQAQVPGNPRLVWCRWQRWCATTSQACTG